MQAIQNYSHLWCRREDCCRAHYETFSVWPLSVNATRFAMYQDVLKQLTALTTHLHLALARLSYSFASWGWSSHQLDLQKPKASSVFSHRRGVAGQRRPITLCSPFPSPLPVPPYCVTHEEKPCFHFCSLPEFSVLSCIATRWKR